MSARRSKPNKVRDRELVCTSVENVRRNGRRFHVKDRYQRSGAANLEYLSLMLA